MDVKAEERFMSLKEMFPCLEGGSEMKKFLTDDKFFTSFVEEELLKYSAKKYSSQKVMTESDEEEGELLKAIRTYKQNRRKKAESEHEISSNNPDGKKRPILDNQKPIGANTELTESTKIDEFNGFSELDEFKKFFSFNKKTTTEVNWEDCEKGFTLNDYIKQGAIPKNKFNRNQMKPREENYSSEKKGRKSKKKKSDTKINEVYKIKSFESIQNCRLFPKKNSPEVKLDDSIQKYSKPFYYIVPENPSPDFFLPRGSYYVVAQPPDISNELVSVVFHPEWNSLASPKNSRSKPSCEALIRKMSEEDQGSKNSFDIEKKKVKTQTTLNIPNNLDNELTKKAQLENLKLSLQEKIEELTLALNQSNKALDELYNVQSLGNLEKNFVSAKQFQDKTLDNGEISKADSKIEDHLSLMTILFPKTEKSYLKEMVTECNERQDLLEQFVENECKRVMESLNQLSINEDFELLLLQLPNCDVKILYRQWAECRNDRGKLSEFVKDQLEIEKIQVLRQSLSSEFPDLEENFTLGIAHEYLNDEEGFKNFIASEKLKRVIQFQLEKMVLALPENNLTDLRQKCEELEGDENAVNEYIIKQQLENKIQSQILNILSVLPNADPAYLRTEIESLQGNDDEINEFINKLLESGDYPKINDEEINSKRKLLFQKYVQNFNVKNFLSKVPNPENYTGAAGDNNKSNPELILSFFQTRFPDLSTDEILEGFELNEKNVTKTCFYFEETIEPIRLCCSGFINEPFDENFLKEVTYIDHVEEISDYMNERKRRKEMEFEVARLDNAFLSCEICTDNELIPSEVATCPEGHIVCRDCLERYIAVKLGDGAYEFPCLFENCDMIYSHQTLQDLLPEPLFLKILKKQQAYEISKAEVEGLESCPCCEFAYIPNTEDKIFKCQNSECMAETCRNCKEKNHIPLRCEEVERSKDSEARKNIEESMTEKLVRKCPACGKRFVKIDGCNKITCTCGTIICYICRASIRGYDHFRNSNHEPFKCPLYSNNEDLHVREVLEEGARARDRLMQEQPDIRIFNDPLKDFR